jgi:surface protein
MFENCQKFNQDYLINWDVSKVENMHSMFSDCIEFNQNLSNWNVSKVDNMSAMFQGCTNFDKPLDWGAKINKVDEIKMSYMFRRCTNFNQDLSTWDVSKVYDMGGMFTHCSKFNQDLSAWDVSKVIDMHEMFFGCISFNQDLSAWDLRSIGSDPYYTNNMFPGSPIEERFKPKIPEITPEYESEEEVDEPQDDEHEEYADDVEEPEPVPAPIAEEGEADENTDYVEAKEPSTPWNEKCFSDIDGYDIFIKDYLKYRNNFTYKMKENDQIFCTSLYNLKKMNYLKRSYYGFYECSESLMNKVKRGVIPAGFGRNDYIPDIEYIKLGVIGYVEKPDWLWNGPVPSPHFELVKIFEEKYFINTSIIYLNEDISSMAHCTLNDKGPVYRFVPAELPIIANGGKKTHIKKHKINTKKSNKKKIKTLKKSNKKKIKTLKKFNKKKIKTLKKFNKKKIKTLKKK